MTALRLRALVVVALAAGAVVAVGTERGPAPSFGQDSSSLVRLAPTLKPPDALSSTFYCAAGSGGLGSLWDHTVVVTNPTDRTITATIDIFSATASALAPVDQSKLSTTTTSTTTEPDSSDASGSPAPTTATTTTSTTIPTTTTTAPTTTTTQPPFPSRKLVPVTARTTVRVRLGEGVAAQFVAAAVEINGGGVAVEQELSGAAGSVSQPCATTASSVWHFAGGDTRRDAEAVLALFNPFADDAVVDLRFVGDGRRLLPESYQRLLVGHGRLVVLDFTPPPPVSSQVDRITDLAMTVEARQGSLVAERLQAASGDGELPAGIAATFGSPAVSDLWYFPHGQVTDDVSQVFTVYNPGDEQAEVDFEVSVDQSDTPSTALDTSVGGTAPVVPGVPAVPPGTTVPPVVGDPTLTVPGTLLPAPTTVPPPAPGVPATLPPINGQGAPTTSVPPEPIEPFALSVPPRSSTRVVLEPDPATSGVEGAPEATRLAGGRVPVGPQFSATVRVRSGPGVVAQQLWRSKGLAPPPSGFFMMLGAPVAARHWELGTGPTVANDPRREFLVVGVPGGGDATVSVKALRQGEIVALGAGDMPVRAGHRLVVDVQALGADALALDVSASEPVVVERLLVPTVLALASIVQGVVVYPVSDTLVPLEIPDPLRLPVDTIPEGGSSPPDADGSEPPAFSDATGRPDASSSAGPTSTTPGLGTVAPVPPVTESSTSTTSTSTSTLPPVPN